MLSRGGGRSRPAEGGSFELMSWYFFRISGLLLVFMALAHVIIMHVVNTVDEIDYEFIANRWESPFWKAYDFLLLVLALLHGVNGARLSVEDYIQSRGWRTALLTSVWLIALVFMVIGALAIVTFDVDAYREAHAFVGGR